MTCASEDGEYHLRIFCGPRVLKNEYMLHKCATIGCPLHSRIIPRNLGEDTIRMNALHNALDKREPSKETDKQNIASITALAELKPEPLSMTKK
jgi:hypothetical protein